MRCHHCSVSLRERHCRVAWGTCMAKFDSILGTVGNTPIVRINNLTPRTDVNFYVKIEAFNPLGSVKDRLALGVIEAAEEAGQLKGGQTVIAATSGTTGIEQVRNPDGSAAAPHPAFKPHPMQGWTPDFIPKLTADAVAMKVIDRVITVPGSEAIHYAGELARKEGIFVGITGGATFAGALRVCAEAPTGANILAMLPDTGERYLSTPLFANVPADMTPEELDISRSTPSAQFAT